MTGNPDLAFKMGARTRDVTQLCFRAGQTKSGEAKQFSHLLATEKKKK
jgi:hypothetical protein